VGAGGATAKRGSEEKEVRLGGTVMWHHGGWRPFARSGRRTGSTLIEELLDVLMLSRCDLQELKVAGIS
jgi:hypothetical protein